MRYIRIPRTDLRPSVVCLGGVIQREPSPLVGCYDEFVERGGNCFDTANVYGKADCGFNANERLLGRWLGQKPPSFRDGVILCTKGGHPEPGQPFDRPRLSRAEIESDLEESLRGLGVDTIDLYWLHRDDPERPVEEILTYLNEFAAQGKIRFFGASNWKTARLRQAEEYARARGIQGFVANQPQWSYARANQQALDKVRLVAMDKDAFRFHQETGKAVLPFSPNARGYFQKLAAGLPLTQLAAERYENPGNRTRAETLKAVAAERGCTVQQAALAFLLHQPFPVVPILGFSSIPQLIEGMGAVDVALDSATLGRMRGGTSTLF
ncbi:MAG: aldo/keto reductase [Oscillospiraceae bacterium]|jgi:aryl-alcohol dehydrogenase-like predicted oxidoreductase|nr:aldo/keto reductase [Oscillospiraceae bacterium]